jgi:bile acid:Na+ symporter, BASS family
MYPLHAVLLFPLAAVLASVAALMWPEPFAASRAAIVPLLGLVMFGMGMTLTFRDFLAVARRPRTVAVGIVLQYLLMPLFAWALGYLLQLPLAVTAGLILVGACPGGTASNVICYLARGDVALSITLTTLSTLLAVLLTPLLTWLYIGQRVPVPVVDMLLSIVLIIIIPVLLGLLLRSAAGARLQHIENWFSWLSMLAIVFIISIIMALNHDQVLLLAMPVAFAVMLHNLLGLGAGYVLPRLLGFDARVARTIAIEVGMQNSGLGVALALKYFSPLSALPGALFSIWHNLSGALLAAWWTRVDGGRR